MNDRSAERKLQRQGTYTPRHANRRGVDFNVNDQDNAMPVFSAEDLNQNNTIGNFNIGRDGGNRNMALHRSNASSYMGGQNNTSNAMK